MMVNECQNILEKIEHIYVMRCVNFGFVNGRFLGCPAHSLVTILAETS